MLNYNVSEHLKKDRLFIDFVKCFERNGKLKTLKKGETLLNEGGECSDLFFIKKGIFKSFKMVDDKEIVIGFTFSGNFDCSPASLFGINKNSYTIEAIVDSEIVKIDLDKFRLAFKNNEVFVGIINVLLIEYIKTMEIRLFDASSLTAEARYKKLLHSQPSQMKDIPLTLIASFLGITNERLSRIRKKMF